MFFPIAHILQLYSSSPQGLFRRPSATDNGRNDSPHPRHSPKNICEFSALPFVQHIWRDVQACLKGLRRLIRRLPPYPSLVLLVVPLAVVEPLKLTTVLVAGAGHWI